MLRVFWQGLLVFFCGSWAHVGGWLSNMAMQLSVSVVTPRVCARVAPTHPAADRRR